MLSKILWGHGPYIVQNLQELPMQQESIFPVASIAYFFSKLFILKDYIMIDAVKNLIICFVIILTLCAAHFKKRQRTSWCVCRWKFNFFRTLFTLRSKKVSWKHYFWSKILMYITANVDWLHESHQNTEEVRDISRKDQTVICSTHGGGKRASLTLTLHQEILFSPNFKCQSRTFERFF